jgi:hypothetical protein
MRVRGCSARLRVVSTARMVFKRLAPSALSSINAKDGRQRSDRASEPKLNPVKESLGGRTFIGSLDSGRKRYSAHVSRSVRQRTLPQDGY